MREPGTRPPVRPINMDAEDRAVWMAAGHDPPDDPDVIERWHWTRW